MQTNKLLETRSVLAAMGTYSPYSNFPVGAAIETANGEIFTGANVENASYGLTVCAERVAAFTAVSRGHRKFTRIAVHATKCADGGAPCGACRQVLYEFGGPDLEVITVGTKSTRTAKLGELLPLAFGPETLENVQR